MKPGPNKTRVEYVVNTTDEWDDIIDTNAFETLAEAQAYGRDLGRSFSIEHVTRVWAWDGALVNEVRKDID